MLCAFDGIDARGAQQLLLHQAKLPSCAAARNSCNPVSACNVEEQTNCYAHQAKWRTQKKSSGVAIYQEMRRMGLPVQEYTPHRGSGDKLARLNSVADIVASGIVWIPETRWAEEVIEEIAGFPFMSHDDLVDSTVMALMRFRQGGFIRLPTDEPDDIRYFKQRRGGYY